MFIKRKEFENILGYYEGKINELENRVGLLYEEQLEMSHDIETTFHRMKEEIDELKENKQKLTEEEKSRNERILRDIKAIQDFSLDDVFDYYMKG